MSALKRPRRQWGFTLLEMLVVIGIIGILAAIGMVNFGNYRSQLRVREAQAQFTVAAEKARNYSRRYGQNYRLTVTNTVGRGSYSIVPYTADWSAEASGVPKVSDQLLPEGFTFVNTAALNVEFTGPLARISAPNTCIGIVLSNLNLSAVVNLIGVTGKVIPRGVQNNTSPCS